MSIIKKRWRTYLENRRNTLARRDSRWARVRFLGYVELDLVVPGDIAVPRKRDVVAALPFTGATSGMTCMIHVHLTMVAPEISYNELRRQLRRWFHGPRARVDVRPFWENRSVEESAGAIAAYGAKHNMESALARGYTETWPLAWKVRYLAWFHDRRGRMQRSRMKLGPQKAAEARAMNENSRHHITGQRQSSLRDDPASASTESRRRRRGWLLPTVDGTEVVTRTEPSERPPAMSAALSPHALSFSPLRHALEDATLLASFETGLTAVIDLPSVAQMLQAQGWPCRSTADALWVGKIGLTSKSEILLDGRVRGVRAGEVGSGVMAFLKILSRITPPPPQSCRSSPTARPLWQNIRVGPYPKRHQRRKADEAIARFLEFMADVGLRVEWLTAHRFRILPGNLSYTVSSGKIRRGRKRLPGQGMIALVYVLQQEAWNPKSSSLYPPQLRELDPSSPCIQAWLDDPLERRWANTLSVQTMKFVAPT